MIDITNPSLRRVHKSKKLVDITHSILSTSQNPSLWHISQWKWHWRGGTANRTAWKYSHFAILWFNPKYVKGGWLWQTFGKIVKISIIFYKRNLEPRRKFLPHPGFDEDPPAQHHAQWWQWDPFAFCSRVQCTMGQAVEIDILEVHKSKQILHAHLWSKNLHSFCDFSS